MGILTARAVDGAIVSEISKGLMVLVGIGTGQHIVFSPDDVYSLTRVDSADDTMTDIEVLTNKMYTVTNTSPNINPPALLTDTVHYTVFKYACLMTQRRAQCGNTA